MNPAFTSRNLLGYHVTEFSTHADILHGEAEICGEHVTHLLSRGIRREDACDVGRDDNNELIWIHLDAGDDVQTMPPVMPATAYTPPSLFEQPQELISAREALGDLSPSVNARKFSAREVLRRIPRKVYFATGVAIVATSVGLNFMGASGTDQKVVSLSTEQNIEEPLVAASEPEQAAVDFVLSGQVEGVVIDADKSKTKLTAHVVSRSGEIVLVEVQEEKEGNLTTFATLLLQKSGATWRIRQVFDPR
jgi:hypothetical protein